MKFHGLSESVVDFIHLVYFSLIYIISEHIIDGQLYHLLSVEPDQGNHKVLSGLGDHVWENDKICW